MTRGLLLAAALLAAMTTDAAACHRYSVWKFPWPQNCGARVAHAQIFSRVSRQKAAIQLPPKPAMPLPSLARADLDEPEADEPTRTRVLLRAALEAANGH